MTWENIAYAAKAASDEGLQRISFAFRRSIFNLLKSRHGLRICESVNINI